MLTLSRSAERLLNGAQIIGKLSNELSSKGRKVLNTIAAKVVEQWLSDEKNKSIIPNQLFRLALDGTAVGMFSDKECSYQPIALKSFVRVATKRKRQRKIKSGGKNENRY
jgi:hypothetical protein